MKTDLSEATRARIAQSLPLMERSRDRIEEAMRRYMAHEATGDRGAETDGTAASAILNLLLGEARATSGATVAISSNRRGMEVTPEHYSSFGDGLKPIMKDVLGPKAPPAVVSAWIDAYWAFVRPILRQDMRLAA